MNGPDGPDTVDVELISPRYLAGGGDPAWITVPLHRARGWSHGHDLLLPRVTLTSPDQTALLRLEPQADHQWWTLQHAATPGQNAWSASFSARTPVEIIAGLVDSLTSAPGTEVPHPYQPLVLAGWTPNSEESALVSPDGTASLFHSSLAADRFWTVQVAVSGYPEGVMWTAHLSRTVPPPYVHGFMRALSDTAPLQRVTPYGSAPPYARNDTQTVTRTIPASQMTSALEQRVRSLTPLPNRAAPQPSSSHGSRARAGHRL